MSIPLAQGFVYILIERHEDEGTDWSINLACYAREKDAEAAQAAKEKEHGNENGDWCRCHGLDWRVETMEVRE